jgi:serine/threonine protein kinase
MVLEYAEGGNLNNWVNKNCENFYWLRKFNILQNIIDGLKEIHQKGLVHRDFHTGNILLMASNSGNDVSSISDMGLCGEVGNIDKTKIYGVMPYVAPEVLRGKPYTQVSDIYSFSMIMYFVTTGRQPFANRAHDKHLVLDIVHKEIRPEINESEVPKCYIDLMKKCWDSNPENRPNATEISKLISSFRNNFIAGKGEQFKESKVSIKSNQSQAIYTSRLLNPFTECLDCIIID